MSRCSRAASPDFPGIMTQKRCFAETVVCICMRLRKAAKRTGSGFLIPGRRSRRVFYAGRSAASTIRSLKNLGFPTQRSVFEKCVPDGVLVRRQSIRSHLTACCWKSRWKVWNMLLYMNYLILYTQITLRRSISL